MFIHSKYCWTIAGNSLPPRVRHSPNMTTTSSSMSIALDVCPDSFYTSELLRRQLSIKILSRNMNTGEFKNVILRGNDKNAIMKMHGATG